MGGMNFDGIPEPWGTLLQLVIGPVGAVVVMALMVYFLWKLFREEQEDNRANKTVIATLATTIGDLTTELRVWRARKDQ